MRRIDTSQSRIEYLSYVLVHVASYVLVHVVYVHVLVVEIARVRVLVSLSLVNSETLNAMAYWGIGIEGAPCTTASCPSWPHFYSSRMRDATVITIVPYERNLDDPPQMSQISRTHRDRAWCGCGMSASV